MRVGLSWEVCPPRQKDLVPVGVGLVPESGAHRLVEAVKRAVLVLQILPERDVVALGIINVLFTIDLVVELPADKVRVAGIMARKLIGDFGRKVQIHRRVEAILPAKAGVDAVSVDIGVEYLWVFMAHPNRCRSGGRTENDL